MAKLRTPLEVFDLGADELNRAATIIPGMVKSVAGAATNLVSNIQSDIESPRVQHERPIPPGTLLAPIPSALGHVVSGAIDVVKSGVDSVIGNVDGAARELEQFVRG